MLVEFLYHERVCCVGSLFVMEGQELVGQMA
jgi:hypothetical protein